MNQIKGVSVEKESGEGKEEIIQNLPLGRLLPFGSCSSAATELLF